MSNRSERLRTPAILAFGAIVALAACTSTESPTASGSAGPPVPVESSPGEGLGSLPGVEGVSYRTEERAARNFLAGANETLAGDAEVEINQSAVATHGSDEVSVISFGFPGAADADAIDYFARVLDDMEDGFQAGSQRGLGGGAYVMSANGESVVLAPWGRAQDSSNLVFLFALGPTGITEQLAAAILGVEG